MISIIIATRDRPEKLLACIRSIEKNNFRDKEIIIADQSNTPCIQNTHTCIRMPHGGKSKALNAAFHIAKGDVIAFTDDDCIVDPNWLTSVATAFKLNKRIIGIFGRTLPFAPEQNSDKLCPSTFDGGNKQKLITKPLYHAQHIGFGNNMAFRRMIFDELGGFKQWLGPGSIGSAAEDAEYALRALIHKQQLLFYPRMIVYHNKWLTPDEMIKQNLSYECGEMACYGHFYFQGYTFTHAIIINTIRDSFYKTKHLFKKMLLLRWNKTSLIEIHHTVTEIYWRGKGLCVGFIYALIDPIR